MTSGKVNKELKFFRHYYELTKEAYLRFFTLDKSRSFRCLNKETKKILSLRVFGLEAILEKLGTNESGLSSLVNQQWSHEDFSLELVHTNDPAFSEFSLIFHPKMISKVSEEEKLTMYLADYLTGLNLVRIFNHELGHILGFRDCYIEFYNKNRGELIYYTLQADQENLMCEISANARIPTSYITQLKNRYCR